jgi:hypothetical protein
VAPVFLPSPKQPRCRRPRVPRCQFSDRFLAQRAATVVAGSHPICAARVDWVLVAVFFSHWFLRCCRCLLFFVNFHAVRGQASVGEPARRFFRLVFFFLARLRSFVLGVALGHGSRRDVSPHFPRRRKAGLSPRRVTSCIALCSSIGSCLREAATARGGWTPPSLGAESRFFSSDVVSVAKRKHMCDGLWW